MAAGRWGRRIGILAQHGHVVPESEYNALTPVRFSIHTARVPLGPYKNAGVMDQTIADAISKRRMTGNRPFPWIAGNW